MFINKNVFLYHNLQVQEGAWRKRGRWCFRRGVDTTMHTMFKGFLWLKYKIITDTGYKKEEKFHKILSFFYLLFDYSMTNFGSLLWDSVTHPISPLCLFKFWPKGHREPFNKVGSLQLAKHLLGFELGTFQFICNLLAHRITLPELGFSRWFDLW